MADHSKPTVTSTYANYTSELDGRLDDLALGLDPATTSPTNVPTNAIRWASASNKWQKWNGSSWGDLSAAYSININGTGTFTQANFADNAKAIFGAGSDLEIYHDGDNSIIREGGTGTLRFQANGPYAEIMNGGATETMARFNNNGSVDLYYDNALKLATTATGIDVTGDVQVSDTTSPTIILERQNSVSGNGLIQSVGNTGIVNAEIQLGGGSVDILKFSTSATQRQLIASNGDISFYEDTGTTPKFFWDASAESLVLGQSNTAGIGEALYVNSGGIFINGENTGINANGLSIGYNTNFATFAVGGTSGASRGMTFGTVSGGVEGVRMTIDSAGSVGIGTSSPANALHIYGTQPLIRLEDTDSGGAYVNLSANTTTGSFLIDVDPNNVTNGSYFRVDTDNGERLIIDSTATVFNEPGNDVDFRIESDTRSSAFFVDGATGFIGLNTLTPNTAVDILGSMGNGPVYTASISGTTMTVTAVSSGTIEVGRIVFGANIQPGTTITALGTGTGGTGTYTVSVSQTAASGIIYASSNAYGTNILRFTSSDTSVGTGQPDGMIQFYGSDASTPGAGVTSYIASINEDGTPDTALVFGTRSQTGGGIDANERVRITSTGNVGIATGSPASFGAGQTTLQIKGNSATYPNSGGIFRSTTYDGACESYYGVRGDDIPSIGSITNHSFAFYTNNIERARIDSVGNFLVGKISDYSAVSVQGISLRENGQIVANTEASGDTPLYVCRDAIGDAIVFFRDGAGRGEIVVNTSSVSYNTTSDYRLKENVTSFGNASSRVLQLNPVRFNFIGDSDTVDGFLAHEAQAVVPEAVTGEKDAVNEDGSPKYQGIDQSKLVPLLTAALQEALAEINALKARLDAANI